MDLVNMKLTSPNHPKAYDPLEQCTWNITARQGHYVTLDFVTIDVSRPCALLNKYNDNALSLLFKMGNE